ncbi:unnamed protein product [Durusdinium trenchii]|uniref:Uncharacterized protein n=1 Tax=Durusdinium trenchii TaxID=1381693 RepID=A0ABP0QST8_9DINO
MPKRGLLSFGLLLAVGRLWTFCGLSQASHDGRTTRTERQRAEDAQSEISAERSEELLIALGRNLWAAADVARGECPPGCRAFGPPSPGRPEVLPAGPRGRRAGAPQRSRCSDWLRRLGMGMRNLGPRLRNLKVENPLKEHDP